MGNELAERIITITTTRQELERWLEASVIAPEELPSIRVIRVEERADDAIDTMIAVSDDFYARTLVGMNGDTELVPGAIEALLTHISGEVLGDDECLHFVARIPWQQGAFGPNTLVVQWQQCEAGFVMKMVERCGATQGIRLARLSQEARGSVSIAVSLPDRIFAECLSDYLGAGQRKPMAQCVYQAVVDACDPGLPQDGLPARGSGTDRPLSGSTPF